MSESNLRILVDVHEAKNQVVAKLPQLGAKVVVEALEVGDYQISNRVVVERKTAADFLQSIIDKRLFLQAAAMCKNFELPVLIIEGYELYGQRNIHPNAVRGALAAMITTYQHSVLFTKNSEETAEMLVAMARQELYGVGEISLRRGKKEKASLWEAQEQVVEAIPYVGPRLAKALLAEFKTISRLAQASTVELTRVGKVGEKRAAIIRKVLSTPYKTEWRQQRQQLTSLDEGW